MRFVVGGGEEIVMRETRAPTVEVTRGEFSSAASGGNVAAQQWVCGQIGGQFLTIICQEFLRQRHFQEDGWCGLA